jgi:hypothetical protein
VIPFQIQDANGETKIDIHGANMRWPVCWQLGLWNDKAGNESADNDNIVVEIAEFRGDVQAGCGYQLCGSR